MFYARHFPIRRGKLRVIDSLWQPVFAGEYTHRIATLKYGGFKISCDLNEMLQRQFYFFGTYFLEEEILDCWQSMAHNAHVIFDVGANAGIYSLAALAVQPAAIVHAFEPTPEIADGLCATAKANGLDHLYVHQTAVSSRDGTAKLRRCRGELGTNEGMNFISQHATDANGEEVPTVCLDQFCLDRSIACIDLLKLDVQGHEYSVLQGAARLIGSGRIGVVFMELNWSCSGSSSPASESINLLDRAGYLFSRPGKHLKWEKAGDWLCAVSDIVARRVNPYRVF